MKNSAKSLFKQSENNFILRKKLLFRRLSSCYKETQEIALKFGIKILIENPGDQKCGTINSAYIQPFLSKVGHQIFGVNFDHGDFASNRHKLDIYGHTKIALPYCEHLYIKDLTKDENCFISALLPTVYVNTISYYKI